ncbi:MAG: hypothetical protein U0Q11_16505 [Vicinamibacterales bacterium]
MDVILKLSGDLYEEIRTDLARPHPFAMERIGFAVGRSATAAEGTEIVLLNRFHSIPDEHYVEDPSVGARIGEGAMTWAMQAAYSGRPAREGIFHVHLHDHEGPTGMSAVDRREIPLLIPGFQSVGSQAAHGIVILSADHGCAWVWRPGTRQPLKTRRISVAGFPLQTFVDEEAR